MEFKNIEDYKKYLNGLSLSKLKQIFRDIDDIQYPERAVIIYRRIKQIEPKRAIEKDTIHKKEHNRIVRILSEFISFILYCSTINQNWFIVDEYQKTKRVKALLKEQVQKEIKVEN